MTATLEKMIFAPPHRPKRGQPAWDIALLFPPQGQWSEDEYLSLCDSTNWLIELNDGVLEVLPMPKPYHQRIVLFLYGALRAVVEAARAGEVFVAPLPVRLWREQMREPDVVFVRRGRISDPHKAPEGADLTIEVVSPGKESRNRDLRDKRRIYAKAGVAEYWIVDPEKQSVTVLQLKGKKYVVHGKFVAPAQATSVLFPRLKVDVATLFTIGEKGPLQSP